MCELINVSFIWTVSAVHYFFASLLKLLFNIAINGLALAVPVYAIRSALDFIFLRYIDKSV